MPKKLIAVFFGVQGSGKSTQTDYCAQKYNLQVFEMGAQLRSLSNEPNELGRLVNETISKGRLLDDKNIEQIVTGYLAKQRGADGNGIIFDGFPRTLQQCRLLKQVVKEYNWQAIVISIVLSDESAKARLLKRTIVVDGVPTKRQDDTPELIDRRLITFHEQTEPIIFELKKDFAVFEVNGEPSPDEVTKQIQAVLDPIVND